MFKSAKTKIAAGLLLAFAAASSQAADLTALTTSITTAVGDAESFGYTILGVGLVASIGMSLVKKFGNKGAK